MRYEKYAAIVLVFVVGFGVATYIAGYSHGRLNGKKDAKRTHDTRSEEVRAQLEARSARHDEARVQKSTPALSSPAHR